MLRVLSECSASVKKSLQGLGAKFANGKTMGKKLDRDVVSREIRHALGTNRVRPAKVHKQIPDDANRQACQEEENFARAREVVTSITPQHPITYDQYDICAMKKDGSLEQFKLAMLQNICKELELEVPQKPIRHKELYLKLLHKAVACCSCATRLCNYTINNQVNFNLVFLLFSFKRVKK